MPGTKPALAMVGDCSITLDGLGLARSDRLGMVQLAETDDERSMLASWFAEQWRAVLPDKAGLIGSCQARCD